MSDSEETTGEWVVKHLKRAATTALRVGKDGYDSIADVSWKGGNAVFDYNDERDQEFSPFRFKTCFSLEYRKEECAKITKKYPDRIPFIIQRAEHSDLEKLDKEKYLVPKDLTVGQFMYVIRKKIRLEPEKAFFIFINNKLVPTSSQIGAIWKEEKDIDGFVYATYQSESTFG